jgi:hypothetical protein
MPAKSIKKTQKAKIISLDVIERPILALRGHGVMFDRDLAMNRSSPYVLCACRGWPNLLNDAMTEDFLR